MSPLLEIAVSAAREAGREIMRFYEHPEVTIKDDGSPVTLADTASNTLLTERLGATHIKILSEESGRIDIPYPSELWVVDPLDGTKDFIQRTADFSVVIGLLREGRPVLGIVYVPVTDTLYYAEKGTGAGKIQNGLTTQLTMTSLSRPLRFICSTNHFKPYMEAVAKRLNAELVPHGSVGVKSALLSENKGEFFFSRGTLGEWDVCAPEIILSEAGGIVTDCSGNTLTYGDPEHRIRNGVLFAHPDCHTEVLEAIRSTAA